ncbi:hypothetical protein QG053_11165, partial [Kingella kingae]|uniref:hypothetical protein n=1 Tax=Kingella kingae TaxID=504 RepID=UPI00254A4998
MFNIFNSKKKANNHEHEDNVQDFTNPAGIDFDNNPHDEVNNEGEVHNVADTRGSNSTQKGFFIICCLGLIGLLGFMTFKSKVKGNEQEQVQAANQANKKAEMPKFELPPDRVASAPAEASAPVLVLDDSPAASSPELPVTEPAPQVEQASAPSPHEIRLRSALMVADNDKNSNEGNLQTVADNSANNGSPQNAPLSAMENGSSCLLYTS